MVGFVCEKKRLTQRIAIKYKLFRNQVNQTAILKTHDYVFEITFI